MTNTVEQITIPASSTGVVVQTIAKAAGKTFAQAFFAALAFSLLPVLNDWQQTLTGGEWLSLSDINIAGQVVFSAVLAGVAALISLAWNYFRTPTLPAGKTTNASAR